MIKSLVNYEYKVTCTYLSNCNCITSLIDVFYILSPYRTSDHILEKIKKSKLDLIDSIPTKYVHDLSGYTHYLYYLEPYHRLKNYFDKADSIYWVTREHFPKKNKASFEDFCDFVCETYPENLHTDIMPYKCLKGDFNIITNLENIISRIGIGYKPSYCEIKSIEIEKIKEYYESL